jgi:hypothetical protein
MHNLCRYVEAVIAEKEAEVEAAKIAAIAAAEAAAAAVRTDLYPLITAAVGLSDWLHGPYWLLHGPFWLSSIGVFDHTPY